jgi:hypothetical protein
VEEDDDPNVGEQGNTGAAIPVFDTGRDALHLALQHTAASHQPHLDRIAMWMRCSFGFLGAQKSCVS